MRHVLMGSLCQCGHTAFPSGKNRGHYRSPGDTSRERTGPCRDCSCDLFRNSESPAPPPRDGTLG